VSVPAIERQISARWQIDPAFSTLEACPWRIPNQHEFGGLGVAVRLFMRDLIILIVHLLTTVFRLVHPGGVRTVVAESLLMKHQLLILNRPRRRAPSLRISDRLIAGFCSLWIRVRRFRRVAIAFKPSTLLNFHRALVQRKYRLLFSPKRLARPGPKGPTADLIRAVVEMKQRNPTWGCPRIAQQINLAFGTAIIESRII
jgi:putative transposase